MKIHLKAFTDKGNQASYLVFYSTGHRLLGVVYARSDVYLSRGQSLADLWGFIMRTYPDRLNPHQSEIVAYQATGTDLAKLILYRIESYQ